MKTPKARATLGDMTDMANWPEMGGKPWPLDRVKRYDNNPRTHPEEQIDLLAKLLKRWGPDQPIVVDEANVILKGHGREEAAHRAGFTHFPVVQRFSLSDAEKKAMRIADNQVALLSGWDNQKLKFEVRALETGKFELGVLGFDKLKIGAILGPAPGKESDPEATPEPSKRPAVRAGDVWVMGDHRIICGDSTDPEVWKALMGRERAAMCFTDPPYGVSYQAPSGQFDVIENDEKTKHALFKMLVAAFKSIVKHTTPTAGIYIWHASVTRREFEQAMDAAGMVERQYLMWAKPAAAFGRADYQWAHEPCFYASPGPASPLFHGDRTNTTAWRFAGSSADGMAVTIGNGVQIVDDNGATVFVQSKPPKGKKIREFRLTQEKPVIHLGGAEGGSDVFEVSRDSNYVHPTQKPVELATLAINNSSRRGEIVVDCFAGSGTTVIGAELTGRRAFVIEMDPQYAEVIVKRWQAFTGKAATLEETGDTFDATSKARDLGKPVRRTKQVAAGRRASAPAK